MTAEPAPNLLDKARAVAAKVARMQTNVSSVERLAHQAEVREALTRTELTVALHESLTQRAAHLARLRDWAMVAYRATVRSPLRRHNRLSKILDRILARLGPRGAAIVIRRSGLAGAPAIFDPTWYLAANPDVAQKGASPLLHYLLTGGAEGRSPGPLLEDARYRAEHAVELAATGLTVLEHYVRKGAAEAVSRASVCSQFLEEYGEL